MSQLLLSAPGLESRSADGEKAKRASLARRFFLIAAFSLTR